MASARALGLAAILLLCLPLPLFASAVIGARPSLRRPLMPWVWANIAADSVAGILVVAAVAPLYGVALAGAALGVCGAGMFRQATLPNGRDP